MTSVVLVCYLYDLKKEKLGGQINNLLLKLRQKQFELGDKPERLLAQAPGAAA